MLSGSLYAFGSFFVTTLTIGVRSVLPIAPLFLARDPETALLLSAAALAVGEWLRAALLWHLLRRAIRAMPAAAPGDAGLGDPPTVWSTALPYGMAMVLMGSVQVVDRVVAGALDPGAITTIDLAEKVFYAPVKILTTSVLLVAGARWAGMVLEQPEDVASDFWQTVRRAALLACALAGAIVVAVAVVLLTVDATVAGVDAGEFGVVLGILMIGFPAAVVTNAGVRLLTVLRRTRVFPRLGIVAFTTSVLGSVVGAATLGTAGIALSGTVWRIVNTALFLSFGAAALRRMGAPEQAGGSDAARPSAVLYPVRMES